MALIWALKEEMISIFYHPTGAEWTVSNIFYGRGHYLVRYNSFGALSDKLGPYGYLL